MKSDKWRLRRRMETRLIRLLLCTISKWLFSRQAEHLQRQEQLPCPPWSPPEWTQGHRWRFSKDNNHHSTHTHTTTTTVCQPLLFAVATIHLRRILLTFLFSLNATEDKHLSSLLGQELRREVKDRKHSVTKIQMTNLNETIQHHVQQIGNLSNISPDFCLNWRIHLQQQNQDDNSTQLLL